MCECCENPCCKLAVLVGGIIFTIVGIGFDWKNYVEINKNVGIENDAMEKKKVDECRIQLQTCCSMILAFVILKCIVALIEAIVDVWRYCADADPVVCCTELELNDFTMLFPKLLLVAFECVVLITLLIASRYCLLVQGKNVFPDIAPDLRNDFLGAFFGIVGISFNRIAIRNFMKIYNCIKSCIRVCQNCQGNRGECDCCDGFFTSVFAVLVILLVLLNVCFVIAYAST